MTAPAPAPRPSQILAPLTWPEVVDRIAPVYENSLTFFGDLPNDIAESIPPQYGGDRLGGFDTTISALAALRGPASVASSIDRVSPLLQYVISQVGPSLDRERTLAAFFTLSYMNVARCCGGPVPEDAAEVELVWLEELAERTADVTQRSRLTTALAMCSAGRTDLLPGFVEGLSVEPGTIAADVVSFMSHLAVAIDDQAGFREMESDWLEFMHRFPYALNAGALGWPALLWAARAMYATLGGRPEAQTATELNRLVLSL